MLTGLVVAGAAMAAAYSLLVFTESGDRVFCGDPLVQGYQKCVDQMALFAIASLIPAMLALILMVAAFATPALRARSVLRAQTLGYSLVAWAIAGGTLIVGSLPAI
ncbi:hypothetical protein EV190_101478 [Actinorugispora endophytica]|uniref:Uncharacterized protein n=1 Tax=Actinorugispora endophytica TaxID=1605990 RepID=A0A4R6V435_9ACTN|nr:hypothetical protein EV190_101478 [Actinorugispora endophytica]